MKTIKNIKNLYKNFKKTLPSIENIKLNVFKVKQEAPHFGKNLVKNTKQFIKELKQSAKNVYENNMKLAVYHNQRGNVFDAIIRYKIAHFFNKKHPEPLLGLADIAIQKKQNKKAVYYFKKAKNLIENDEDKKQIETIIHEISL